MSEFHSLNEDWQFHLGELEHPPKKLAKKAFAFGGFTAATADEQESCLPISAGGKHFLGIIAQGNTKLGLQILCGTDLESELDGSWKELDLPHDWKVELPYENTPANLMSGSKADGVAYYRKRFVVNKEKMAGKEILLHFDGVARIADIWLNGSYLGQHIGSYASFSFDISPLLYDESEGENTLLVRVETHSGAEGWWYEGAGIYKSVSLEIRPQLYIDPDTIYIYTKKLEDEQAILGLEVDLVNHAEEAVQVSPQVKIAGQDLIFKSQTIEPFEQITFKGEIALANPQLWSPEYPYLYQAIFSNGDNQVSRSFGIRTFEYKQEGFYLNGQPYSLRGVCEHQDFAGLGVALRQDIVDYKILTLKKMGINSIRSAHHFASKELLDACDRLGILLMNENRLPEATPWRLSDFKREVKRTRSHASLAFWSLANEELVGNTPFGSQNIAVFAKIVRHYQKEALLISAELLNPEGIVDEDYLKQFDILGVNYPEAGVMGEGASSIHKKHPTIPMMSTENASYFSTRGIYRDNESLCQCNNLGSLYSMILPGKRQAGEMGVGGTAHPEEVMAYLKKHPYMGGLYLWTGFDYFGEPSPFAWPGISSQFGICDVNGFPKDYYYYYQAQWTQKPMVHLLPHWNGEALEFDQAGKTLVRAFSNSEEVELFVNGLSQGRKKIEDCQANWALPYEAGKLEVRAYMADQVIASERQLTSGEAVAIQQELVYSGQELDLIKLKALDEKGNFVPTADQMVHVLADGATVLGLGNGNPADISDHSLEQIQLFSGLALVIVKKRKMSYQLTCEMNTV